VPKADILRRSKIATYSAGLVPKAGPDIGALGLVGWRWKRKAQAVAGVTVTVGG